MEFLFVTNLLHWLAFQLGYMVACKKEDLHHFISLYNKLGLWIVRDKERNNSSQKKISDAEHNIHATLLTYGLR